MMLSVEDLTAGYGRVEVLRGVSLTVGAGEIVALVGPNGAGKSTLLRAVTAMIPDRSGSVTMDGRQLIRARVEDTAAAGIAHVPEGRRLFPGLTVRDNLRLGGWRTRARGGGPRWRAGRATGPGPGTGRGTGPGPGPGTELDARREAGVGAGVDDTLESVLELFPRLRERLHQVAGSLSGGEQQMCAIARGLMSRPRLLLIDELSLGLAPLLVDEILARLAGIAAQGTGVLLVEQDASAALEVAQRGYVLELGRIVLDGTAAELADDPRIRTAYLGVV